MRYVMGTVLCLLVLLAGCGGGGGSNNTDVIPPPTADTGNIEGYLSASIATRGSAGALAVAPQRTEQQPVAGATVRVDDLGLATTTDGSGHFAFTAVATGIHQLVISHPEYRDPVSLSVLVKAGQTARADSALGVGYYICVGAGDYLNLPDSVDLVGTPTNARMIADVFFPSFYGNGTLLINADATKNSIKETILATTAKMTARDFLVFFYSGHGDSQQSNSGKLDMICPTDMVLGDFSTYIKDTELRDWLGQAPNPQRNIVILDTCFAGGFADGVPSRSMTPASTLYALKAVGCTVLSSSTPLEYSWEINGVGNFTRQVARGLDDEKEIADTNRDHAVTAQELFDYAAPRTTEAMDEQHPALQVGENPVLIRY